MSKLQRWLHGLGLERFSEVFEREELTLDNLPELTDEELKELGLPLGPRKKLLKAIEALRGTKALRSAARSGFLHARSTSPRRSSPPRLRSKASASRSRCCSPT